jgi:hypothetical protein
MDKYKELANKIESDFGVNVLRIEEENGSVSLFVDPNTVDIDNIEGLNKAVGSVVNRSRLQRSKLDLMSEDKLVYEADIHDVYKKSRQYYISNEVYGPVIRTLTNLACRGFENDCSDSQIKYFFDQWCFDIKFKQLLRWIFQEFFRSGFVRTYKTIGKYEPRISYITPPESTKKTKAAIKRELAAAKKKWSASHIPIQYTVLNPEVISIEGSLLFDNTSLVLQPTKELQDLVKKSPSELSPEDKEVLKSLPAKFKSALKDGKSITIDPEYVGAIDYNKMPYERYPYPRGSNVFDSLVYKQSLRDADLSTLDGISNYILKITVGNDKYPVTSPAQLQKVAELFNTTSKAFDVVYNHTLQIEKIVSPEIESILGKKKYEQVNDDLYTGLTFPRVLLDGGFGDLSTAEVNMCTKAVVEEVHYAREQVSQWIYDEYVSVAEALKFDLIPKVRWDEKVLKNEIDYMNVISKLVDRRMLSYRTALEKLGFDFPSELSNVREELPIVLDEGAFGIVGSPWQQAKTGIQPTQGAPTGTPSDGRPSGDTVNDNDSRTGDSEQTSAGVDFEIFKQVSSLSEEEKIKLQNLLSRITKT